MHDSEKLSFLVDFFATQAGAGSPGQPGVANLKRWGEIANLDLASDSALRNKLLEMLRDRPEIKEIQLDGHQLMIHRHHGVESYNQLAPAELSSEQNYNMIDGVVNNLPYDKADLTDGQTYDELAELAPETLPETKQSLLEQVRSWEDTVASGHEEAVRHEPHKEEEIL